MPPKDFEDFMNNILLDKEYQPSPLGLSRLASCYVHFKNADIFPSFRWSTVRVTLHRALRCAFLERKIIEFDRRHEAHLKGYTENQKRPPGQPPVPEEVEDLMDAYQEARVSYQEMFRCYQEMQQLPPAPETQYRNIVELAMEENMLSRDGYALFDGDMVSGSKLSNAAPIVNFIHSRCGRWLLNMLGGRGSDVQSRLAQEKTAELVLKCFLIFIGSILLVVPVSLLYLADLTRGQSFGIITGFTLLFAIVTMLSKDWEVHKTLVAVCAYCAVLFTIGAQTLGTNT
ncbi:hypothetical protein V8F20_003786 [Naviculisporaceae sp. PSN 640]